MISSADDWTISSFCHSSACVGVRRAGAHAVELTSTDGQGRATLHLTVKEFDAFVRGVKNGDFDQFTTAEP